MQFALGLGIGGGQIQGQAVAALIDLNGSCICLLQDASDPWLIKGTSAVFHLGYRLQRQQKAVLMAVCALDCLVTQG